MQAMPMEGDLRSISTQVSSVEYTFESSEPSPGLEVFVMPLAACACRPSLLGKTLPNLAHLRICRLIGGTPIEAEAMDEVRFNEFLYARGYLLTAYLAPPPKLGWRQVQLGTLYLGYDPVNPFALAEAPLAGARCAMACALGFAILGRVLDTQNWQSDNAILAKDAARALARSEEALLDRIDHWNGALPADLFLGGKTRLMTDACAMRSAYYSFNGGLTVASHARIVADLTGAGPCPKMAECAKDPRWAGSVGKFPGNATPFADVWVLTPNTLIDVEDRVVRRFFPRAPLTPLSSEEAAEIAAPILRRTALIWAEEYPLVASLTAGITPDDARGPEGCARKISAVSPTSGAERRHRRGLRGCQRDRRHARPKPSHDLSWRKERDRYGRPFARLTTERLRDASSGRRLGLFQHFAPGTVHLRSNLGEIGRAFYRKSGQIQKGVSLPRVMADVFKPQPMGDNPLVVEAFEQFVTVTQFDRIANYDPCDLLYWEQRMSSWHSSLLLESDPACDTLTIFNNRSVLSTLLSAPLKDRITSKSFYFMIARLWPELLRYRVNGKAVPKVLGRLGAR